MKLCREGGLKNWPFSVVLGESHHFASQTTNRHKKHMQELDLGSEKCVMIKIYYSNGLFFCLSYRKIALFLSFRAHTVVVFCGTEETLFYRHNKGMLKFC